MSESRKDMKNGAETATNVPYHSSTKSEEAYDLRKTQVQRWHGSSDSIGTWQRQVLIESEDPRVPTEGLRFSHKLRFLYSGGTDRI